jgi:UDP-glucose:glycoprotein glucosyltransferase
MGAPASLRVVFRHGIDRRSAPKMDVLPGYGVELAVKSSEYKVNTDDGAEKVPRARAAGPVGGIDFKKLEERYPQFAEKLAALEGDLSAEEDSDLVLQSWEIENLGIQLIHKVKTSEDPFATFVNVLANFPAKVVGLARSSFPDALKMDLKKMSSRIPSGVHAMMVNGFNVASHRDSISLFRLIDNVKPYFLGLERLLRMGVNGSVAADVMTAKKLPVPRILDWRSPLLKYIYNVEKDAATENWETSLQMLLYQMPGRTAIRKVLHNIVLVFSPSNQDHMELAASLLTKGPTRVAFVLHDQGEELDRVAIDAYGFFLREVKVPKQAKNFFMDLVKMKEPYTMETLKASFDKFAKKLKEAPPEDAWDTIVAAPQPFSQECRKYVQELGLPFPSMLWNGEVITTAALDVPQLVPQLMYYKQQQFAQAFYTGQLKSNVEKYILRHGALAAFHEAITPDLVLKTSGSTSQDGLDTGEATYVVLKASSLKLVAPWSRGNGKVHSHIIFIGASWAVPAVEAVADHLEAEGNSTEIRVIALGSDPEIQRLRGCLRTAEGRTDALREAATKSCKDAESTTAELSLAVDADALTAGLVLVTNGKRFDIKESTPLTAKAFAAAESVTSDIDLSGYAVPADALSTTRAVVGQVLSATEKHGMAMSEDEEELISQLPASMRMNLTEVRPDLPVVLRVKLIMDPLSKLAQSALPLIALLHRALNAQVEMWLRPQLSYAEYPIKRWYKEVINWPPTMIGGPADQLGFDIAEGGRIHFSLSTSHTLTMAVHCLPTWLLSAHEAEHDLDNLREVDAPSGVSATFVLSKMFMEGQAMLVDEDGSIYNSAKGVQLEMSTHGGEYFSDALVMGNMGYFQTIADPGLFAMDLKAGPSNDTMFIPSRTIFEVSSYLTPTYLLKLRVHEGKDPAMVYDPSGKNAREARKRGQGMFGMFFSWFDSEEPEEPEEVETKEVRAVASEEETVHIFSVASGHLYEKLLQIMMVSVLRNTKSPVHFWFIDNFLSPRFKRMIPVLSKKFGFQFEFVTYKWPSWLNPQSEKQRLIWAYKILFLDVLFPLDVHRIIFIDADQVVRADVKELWDMDLDGAPYAFTPMCDSNPDTEGFRFWKQGYWKNHLRGKPYHISALFVVDLDTFRRKSTGDALRSTYNALSQDPNSLANLDQDLPNFAQHEVPIFSLPQEWLYCATWCSEDTMPAAKTIDLCQNPLTKEPKLKMAERLITEWKGIFDDISVIHKEFDDHAEL